MNFDSTIINNVNVYLKDSKNFRKFPFVILCVHSAPFKKFFWPGLIFEKTNYLCVASLIFNLTDRIALSKWWFSYIHFGRESLFLIYFTLYDSQVGTNYAILWRSYHAFYLYVCCLFFHIISLSFLILFNFELTRFPSHSSLSCCME